MILLPTLQATTSDYIGLDIADWSYLTNVIKSERWGRDSQLKWCYWADSFACYHRDIIDEIAITFPSVDVCEGMKDGEIFVPTRMKDGFGRAHVRSSVNHQMICSAKKRLAYWRYDDEEDGEFSTRSLFSYTDTDIVHWIMQHERLHDWADGLPYSWKQGE